MTHTHINEISLGLLLTVALCLASCQEIHDPPHPAPPDGKVPSIIYIPPPDSPDTRVEPEMKGSSNNALLQALVPRQTSHSTVSTPTLYWCVSQVSDKSMVIEITLKDANSGTTVLQNKKLDEPKYDGIYSFPLANVSLQPNVNYKWLVTLRQKKNGSNESNESSDKIGGGIFKYQKPNQVLSDRLDHAPKSERPSIYARNSYWYDTIKALLDQARAQAGRCDENLRRKWEDLLSQGELKSLAGCTPCINEQ